MSASRGLSKNHSLPANVQYIEFSTSDGDSLKWPKDTKKIVDNEGCVNFMDPTPIDEPIAVKWRSQVGQALAKQYPAVFPGDPNRYALKDWPAGYAMFVHNKGKASGPRQDVYLIGGPPARFRSVPEFIPHAIYLMRDRTNDMQLCQCKYCSKTAQRDITKSMSDIMPFTTQSPGPSRAASTSRPNRVKPYKKREKNVYAAVHPKVREMPQRAGPPLSPMVRERNSDLRAVSGDAKKSMELRRWFRQHELVWCSLDRPIPGHTEAASILFWPCIVEEVWTKSEAIPAHGNGESSASTADDSASAGAEGRQPLQPWSVRQYTEYTMRLLPGAQQWRVGDHQVLPYQAHAPSRELISALNMLPRDRLNFDPETVARFNPAPPPQVVIPAFEEAAAPYALAIQIGAKVSGFWSLTDDYEFKFNVTPRPVPPPPPPPPAAGVDSITAAIMAAGSSNARRPTDGEAIAHQYYHGVSGPAPNMPPNQLQQLATQMLGAPPPTHSVTQIRYQGLWWGAERIWCDDFVRLKVRRACFAPHGAQHILPPSGPGKAMQEKWKMLGKEEEKIGAASRGVFMRLEGIIIVDVPQPDGTAKKECRVSGVIYELADLDWEEPATSGQPGMNGHGATPSHAFPALPGPSPLKPSALPNPDPAASVSSTAASFLHQGVAAVNHMPPPPARPVTTTTYYPLPQPPAGYKWRAVVEPGHEVVMSLSLVSGRYYPGVLLHPLLRPAIERATANALEDGGLMEYNYLWSLEGLAPGFFNSVDPVKAKPTRSSMLLDAHKDARAELEAMLQTRMDTEKAEDEDVAFDQLADGMEVDS